ncbi:hypothetical protein VOLCADRAFT_94683 [Volvox carteri f. nagariensis]|uniref:Exonuclease domain-containing protein n=1 Tax=Volvox carteri f. nagariensis TaxID=3068 RepID=D8U5G4_VOLCA|nr:uncharacterized protein VOLCADRAFT_94683 [Volvox carteri f. nagariensis]EFJ44915.1 hypothetical protein VOLCADRAFT_94683 [Volvox carteri f. nagariensis]|eukprot:XP_002953886.1 hypothetical protein VOLCADRAFT_94683 [Volvox carteri f. nagariensis]
MSAGPCYPIYRQGRGSDPKKQKREVLEAYVADLLAPEPDGAPSPPPQGAATAASEFPRDFAQRYLKWAQAIRQDSAKGRGVLPPLEPSEPATTVTTTSPAAQQHEQRKQQQQQKDTPREAQVEPQQVSVWSLVRRTRAHDKYEALYGNLPSYMPGWVRVKRSHLSPGVRPQLLAVDCEMCATEEDDSALLGVCVVDEFGEVVYRQLVRPTGRIKDLRTALTDAQKAVRKLLQPDRGGANGSLEAGRGGGGGGERPVVLVGHSLHHDLTALKLDHQPVIDTSLIFPLMGLPNATPGLKDLARGLLGLEMRKGRGGAHDSREDAAVTMRLVMRELQMAVPSGPLEPPQTRVSPADLAKLLVHGLREGRGQVELEEELRGVLAAAGAPGFDRLEQNPDHATQLLLVFKTPAVANEAFKKLPGKQDKDSLGRFFKQVSLSSGKICKIRKMACHGGMAFGVTSRSGGGAKTQAVVSASAAAQPASKRAAKRARSAQKCGSSGDGGGENAGAAGGALPGGCENPSGSSRLVSPLPPATFGMSAGALLTPASRCTRNGRQSSAQEMGR